VEVSYPIGHRRRRDEGIPVLRQKFASNMATTFDPETCQSVGELFDDESALQAMSVNDFMSMLVRESADMNSMLA
jgi:2-methylcitrate dehydratase